MTTKSAETSDACDLCGDKFHDEPALPGFAASTYGSPSHPDQVLCQQCALDCIEGLHEHHIVEG